MHEGLQTDCHASQYDRVVTVFALVLGAIGAGTGLYALYFSARSVTAAEKSAVASELSAKAVTWSNASALAPAVEVALRGEIRERWKFIFANSPLSPMGNLPVVAKQDESYPSPASDDLTVACATWLQFTNKGDRLAYITINSTSLAFDSPIFNQLAEASNTSMETRTPLSSATFELAARKERTLVIYSGRTVGEWLDSGEPSEPEKFEVFIDIGAGPDAATLHWRLTMKAKIFESVVGQTRVARIVAALPPESTIVELPRTIRSSDQSRVEER